MRKLILFLVVSCLCLGVVSGCSKLDRGGVPPENVPPKVFFVNIPPEGTEFSINPRVYWYGTDVDGFITAYQYAVMRTDSLVSWGGLDQVKSFLHDIPADSASWTDQTSLRNMIGVHVQAEPGGHSRNVMMFAEMDPSIYTPQYLFLRAVDNGEKVSDDVIHRLYYRNNHRPEAVMEMDSAFSVENHYCLVESTETWKGISISWSGQDLEDYPDKRNQPDFQFKWELVGPFESAPTALTVDTTAVVDSSLDSAVIAGEMIYTRWVSAQTHVFTDLKNYGEDVGADVGYGWYQLRVRARDDAFVSTDTATTLNFRTVKPKFRYTDADKRTILVVDATAYAGPDGAADTAVEVRPLYQGALEYLSQAGLCDGSEIWWDPTKGPREVTKSAPSEDVLSRYDLTILLNVGSMPGINDENYKAYRDYLDVGGRLWLIGLNNFRVSSGREPHELEGIRSTDPNTFRMATEYFGLDAVFRPTYTVSDSMTLEFIGATPFGLWEDLPALKADTTECKKLKGYEYGSPVRWYGVRGIPYVCYDGMSNNLDAQRRIPAERRMFSVVSYYGSISPMQNRPVAVNWVGPTYRTAEFCFPLHLMENHAPDHPVYEVVEKTVEWFWEELP
ncbi:MAG: hypothetical protein GTO24_27160 [candidate division Zixibacteria bacterium]|nr:hypothetical protein [candidate division Zixibacteria bacterium]